MSRNKGLKYFTLSVMNLYNIWVSLSEMSDKKILIFFMIFKFFLDVPVCDNVNVFGLGKIDLLL